MTNNKKYNDNIILDIIPKEHFYKFGDSAEMIPILKFVDTNEYVTVGECISALDHVDTRGRYASKLIRNLKRHKFDEGRILDRYSMCTSSGETITKLVFEADNAILTFDETMVMDDGDYEKEKFMTYIKIEMKDNYDYNVMTYMFDKMICDLCVTHCVKELVVHNKDISDNHTAKIRLLGGVVLKLKDGENKYDTYQKTEVNMLAACNGVTITCFNEKLNIYSVKPIKYCGAYRVQGGELMAPGFTTYGNKVLNLLDISAVDFSTLKYAYASVGTMIVDKLILNGISCENLEELDTSYFMVTCNHIEIRNSKIVAAYSDNVQKLPTKTVGDTIIIEPKEFIHKLLDVRQSITIEKSEIYIKVRKN